jgi:eukaryotic-like serine/threonine-protein kinase
MSLTVGARLGHYDVVEFCAAGGMGEVYRARDTRLNRDVALKVLPDAFLNDSERLTRFRREAQVLASLNHTNIAAIYGLEESALVMEFVDGETLADVIAAGLRVDEALTIARQIADALETAHEHGIVHRDLKPANVKIKTDGTVKVLDFGLAKALDHSGVAGGIGRAGGKDALNSPTITSPAQTAHGVILGTAAYMSPEQARGLPADKRSDIWAFGVVLYEMVTGRRLFRGDHVTDVLASIVRDTPDLSAAPAPVRRLLEKCLEKDPRKRLHDISSVALLLEEPQSGPTAVAQAARAPAWTTPRLAALGAVLVLLVAGAAAVFWPRPAAIDDTGIEFSVHAPQGTLLVEPHSIAAIAPDGKHLLFGTNVPDSNFPAGSTARYSLWIRPIESTTARVLAGTEGATSATWSPDSRSIAFLVDGTLRRLDIGGGPPVKVADVPGADRFDTGAWNANGTILLGCRCGLDRVTVATGEVTRLRAIDKALQETSYSAPQFLPDGEHFLYFVHSTDRKVQGVYASSLSRPEERTLLLNTAARAAYVPSPNSEKGHLLWMAEQTLQARPFTPASLTFEGEPVPIAQNVSYSELSTQQYTYERPAFSSSTTGLLVYAPAVLPPYAKMPMGWVERTGRLLGDVLPEGPYAAIAISPDQQHLAVTRRGIRRTPEPNGDIWLWNFARSTMTRLTFHEATDENPIWSPDGQQVAFSTSRHGPYQVYRKNASGTGEEERLTNTTFHSDPLDWSPDGRFIVYRQMNRGTRWDLYLIAVEGDREPVVLLQTPESDSDARFSPDGKFLAYHSRLNGSTLEIYVQRFNGTGKIGLIGERLQVSNNTGGGPLWRKDGRELYYRTLDGTVMAVDIELSPTLRAGRPRELFRTAFVDRLHPYAVTGDAQRFIFLQPTRELPEPLHLNVVMNWQRRLLNRKPTK